MRRSDPEWILAYDLDATEASTTLGGSTGDQTAIYIKGKTGLTIRVSNLTLAGGITLRVYVMIGDDASTPVYGYRTDLGGTSFPLPIDGLDVAGGSMIFPDIDLSSCGGSWLKIDVTVDSTDATAAADIHVLRSSEV